MSQVTSAQQAIEIANEFLESAKIALYIVTKTISRDKDWLVEVFSFGATYGLVIDKDTGKITEYRPI